MALESGNVAVCHGANAKGGNTLLIQYGVKGNIGGDGQLAADVIAVDVGAGVGFGITQLLRLFQNGRKADGGGVHGIHNEIGGAVHNTAHFGNRIQTLAAFQIGQPGDTAAHGGRTAQSHAVFPGQGRQVRIVSGNQRLVGGDHMLFRLQRGTDILVRRMQTAHDLHHRINGGIVEDLVKIAGGNGGNFLDLTAHQYAANGQIRAVFGQFIHAAAYDAEA